jgi:hypothetical protein
MSASWKNIYPGGKNGIHVASDNPDAVYRLVESLLEAISALDASLTRNGTLEATGIAESIWSSLDNPGNTDFSDSDFHDINSNSSVEYDPASWGTTA